jgi:hypothetical protein
MPLTVNLYHLMAGAILARRQVCCTYHGIPYEVCPIVLGRKNGAPCVLTWQFAGMDEEGDFVEGRWQCLPLDEVADVRLHDGPWYPGDRQTRPKASFDDVDLDAYSHVGSRSRLGR